MPTVRVFLGDAHCGVDRWIVLYGNDVFTMSDDPDSPHGVNMFAGTYTKEQIRLFGPDWGREIPLDKVPPRVREAIVDRGGETCLRRSSS